MNSSSVRDRTRKVIDLYCRISNDYDGTFRSVESQEELGRADVAAHAHEGWEVGKVFRDPFLSAWNPKVVRPEFTTLMERLESGEADGVWVRNLDRFTRKMAEGERLLEMAKAGKIVDAHDGRYDLTTARGQKNFREDMVDAAYESDRTSERTVRGKRDKARRGKSNASHRGFGMEGYQPKPEGWEPGDPRTPVPQAQVARERAAIREVVRRLLSGGTLAAQVDNLNAEGFTTYTGGPWSDTSLRNSLRRPALAGIVEHRGEEVGVMAGEPILDRDTYDRLQSFLASRKRGRALSDTYLLSGLLVCGREGCGARLYGRPRVSRSPYPDGEVAREYWCQPRNNTGGCGRLNVDQRFADSVVTEAVLERLSDPRHAKAVAAHDETVRQAREDVGTELARLDQEADTLAEKTATWGVARVDKALKPILARQAELRGRLETLDASSSEGPLVDPLTVAADWARDTPAERRAKVRQAFPDGITVRPATSRGRAAKTTERFRF